MKGNLPVWYDEEGNYLELTREEMDGFFVNLGDSAFERVDKDGDTIGFAVFNLSSRKGRERSFDVTFEKQSSEA